MINQSLSPEESALPALFRLGFRPLFLGGCLFGSLALLLWGFALSGKFNFQPFGNAMWWHPHEMIYGFCCAIIVGFLLTAVQTWTGVRGLRGWKLLALFLFWVMGRLLLLGLVTLPAWLVVWVDALFMPVSAVALSYPLVKVWQVRNLFFVPVLFVFSATNLMSYAGLLGGNPILVKQAFMAAIFLIVMLMVVLGGRVIPFFTASGLKRERVMPLPLLEWIALGSCWILCVLIFLAPLYKLPMPWMAGLFALAGLSHLLRFLRWKGWTTFQVPLLWSLHMGYLFIPLGLLAFAWGYWQGNPFWSVGIHALTAGAMSTMIIAMVARVSLGHTGRLLEPHPVMSLAFICVITAGLVRAFVIWAFPSLTSLLLQVSVAAWVLGFAIFCVVYWPILTKPRIDGRAG